LNLSAGVEVVSSGGLERARVLLSTHPARAGARFDGRLADNEAVVLALAE
jgi:hypothetical protein